MTQLPTGPPTKPFTELTPEGIQKIRDRLSLVLDTRGFDDSMTPVVKNIVETLITQDMPALLADLEAPKCADCASIHRVHHVGRGR